MNKRVLITGGAGFIGSNLAERSLRGGTAVLPLDNLSHRGAERNLCCLCETYGSLTQAHVDDFESNLLGTLNILEAIRKQDQPLPRLFTSTSNVYGNLHHIESIQTQDRTRSRDPDTRRFTEATGWTPQISVEQGISQLHHGLLDGAQSGVSQARE